MLGCTGTSITRPRTSEIVLLEGGERVLPAFPPELSEKATKQLERLGVTVRTGALVRAVDAAGVAIGDERIAARTVIWGAGVRATALLATIGAPLDRVGRVRVGADLAIPGAPEVFVIGDAAVVEQDGAHVPGVAPAAIQMGRHVARQVERALAGRELLPFRYRDKGSLATIGRASAVADFGRVRLSGPIAWVTWLVVHVFFLIGFRTRVVVLFDWAWSWLTYQRVARVVPEGATRPDDAGE